MQAPAPNVLRTLTLIVAAMTFGLASFAALAFILVRQGIVTLDPTLGDALLLALPVLGVGELLAYLFVRRAFVHRAAESQPTADVGDLTQRFFMLTLIAAALAEGFGLFGAIVHLVSGRWEALLATLLALLLLATRLPVRERFERFAAAARSDF